MRRANTLGITLWWLCSCYAVEVESSPPDPSHDDRIPAPTPSVPWDAPVVPQVPTSGPGPQSQDEGDAWDGVLHVAASAEDPDLLVVWSPEGILLSNDDGASFEAILVDGPVVWDVAVSDSVVWALRDGQLYRRDSDGRERSWAMPAEVDTDLWSADYDDGGVTPRLAASRTRVAVIVPDSEPTHLARILGHRGDGRWRTTIVKSTVDSSSIGINEYREPSIDERGRAQLTVDWGQGTECGVTYVTTHRGRLGQSAPTLVAEYEDPMALSFAHDGWVYAHCVDDYERLCTHPPGGARPANETETRIDPRWVRVELETDIGNGFGLAHGHAHTVALADRSLVRLKSGRAQVIASDVPEGTELLAVDAVGRPLAVAGAQLVRWSPESGWSPLPLDGLTPPTNDAPEHPQ